MRTRAWSLVAAVAVAAVLIPSPGLAHKGLKTGRYECWLTQITMYSNYDIKIVDGNSYVFMLNDGSWKKSGSFNKEGNKLYFTSGYLKEKNFKGKYDSYNDSFGNHVHLVYLYKGGWDSDDLKYDCNND